MAHQTNQTGYAGVFFRYCAYLTGVFVLLKLGGIIAWPWYAVLAPFAVPATLWLLLFVVTVFLDKREGF